MCVVQEERSKVDDLRGSPMSVGTLEEIIDDNHAIVSTSVGSEHYVSILSFVDKDQLEPGCSVLLNHKVGDAIYTFIITRAAPAASLVAKIDLKYFNLSHSALHCRPLLKIINNNNKTFPITLLSVDGLKNIEFSL